MTKGYVYVLSNEGMPGLRKIGRSKEGGKTRARQLYQTGVPYPFVVEFELLTDEPEWVEATVHETLKDRRSNGSREFFAVSEDDAMMAVIRAHVSIFDQEIVHGDEAAAIVDLCATAHEMGEHWMDVVSSVSFVEHDAIRKGIGKRKEAVAKHTLRFPEVAEARF